MSGHVRAEWIVDLRDANGNGEFLRRMNRKLSNRWLDAEGYSERGPANLGYRRLSVIDLASSLHPMASADGRHTLVHNGELYNFMVLRAELEALGRTLRARGDTEVLLKDRKSNGTSAGILLSGGHVQTAPLVGR